MHVRLNAKGIIWFCAALAILMLFANYSCPAMAQNGSSQSEITLNLKDANLRQVVQMVSQITGKNFIVDPRAQGRVTVISSRPISGKALFQVFLSVLEVHGLAAVPAGHDTWKIVPAVQGRQEPGTTGAKSKTAPSDAIVTEVVPVKNVKASQLVPALRPLMSSFSQLSAYPPSNMVILSGRAGNIRRMTDLIHKLDKPMVGDIDMIPLKNASAVNVAQVLSNMLQNQGQGEMPVKIAADPRLNSLLVSGSRAQRLKVKALVSELDSPAQSGGNTQVIYLHYAHADALAKILQGYIKGEAQAQPSSNGKGNATGSETSKITVTADKQLNALIVTAPSRQMQQIHRIINQLDVRRAQVLVQGIIAELSSNKAAQLGISWATDASQTAGAAGLTNFPNGVVDLAQTASGVSGGLSNAASSAAATGQSLSSQLPRGLLFGVGRLVQNGVSFAALLNALASTTSTNILSTPSLVTLDNQQATLVSGQNVPFVTGQYTNATSANQTAGTTFINPFQTVQRQQLGVTLKIKPQINYGGDTVTLNIDAEDQSLAPSVNGASGLITNKRQLKTSILAKSGQIIVLGGLINTNVEQSQQKVPLLGDIPLLGNLFRYRSSQQQKDNLMIFLRPTILHNEKDTNAATMPRYNRMRDLQQGRNGQIILMPNQSPPILPKLHPSSSQGPAAASASHPANTATHGHPASNPGGYLWQ